MLAHAASFARARRRALTLTFLGVFICGFVQAAEKPTSAQRKAAQEFLAAVATGDPQSVAYAIHPAELDALRQRLLTQMRDEATRKDNTIRARLFGPGMPLADLERMTSVGFYTALTRRFPLGGREYQDVDGLAAIPDKDGAVLVVVRGKPPRERGTVSIAHVVAVKPYGKDWKAVVPPQIEAQIEDLIKGRRTLAPPATSGGAQPAPAEPGAPPAIVQLLGNAEQALTDGKCTDYYGQYMSPNFRRVTSKKAREALIASCQRGGSVREMLLATLHIVRGLVPKFEYEGARAVYDLSGQGLPYDRFVLEEVDKKWYIAE